MNTWDKCKNCGGERGLHHYQTDQCPVGGREAPVGRKQEWKTTTFEIEDDSASKITLLKDALEEVESLCDSEMGDWNCVLPPYIPEEMMGLFNIREAARTALAELKEK